MTTAHTRLALATACALLATPALADGPDWTWLQAGYYQMDGYDSEAEIDGLQVQGSLGFAERWHAQATWLSGDIDSDADSARADFDGYRVTLGAHTPVVGNVQLVSDLFYYDIDRDGAEGSFITGSTEGYGVGFGLRTVLADKVDLQGMVTWTSGEAELDGDQADFTDFGLSLMGRYNWTPALSTGLQFNSTDATIFGPLANLDSAVLDLRWSFGADLF